MRKNFYNTEAKIRYRRMIKGGDPIRGKKGQILKAADFQSKEADLGKIHADKKWFKATRVISERDLEKLQNTTLSPYEVLLKKGKVPFDWREDTKKRKLKVDFQKAFGKNSCRKRPNLNVKTLDELKEKAEKMQSISTKENNSLENIQKSGVNSKSNEDYYQSEFIRGQSKRIWNELYKVVDCSHVIIHVLDARDPLGTICPAIEKYVSENTSSKTLIYLINKVDLIPTEVTSKWLNILSKKHPTLAYHSSALENSYGKENLLSILRQYRRLKSKQISVGFVGYPNVGKSSVINTLKNKSACSVAPIPGQTKLYQYITLTKKIYLIDSPGVVPVTNQVDAVLKGAIRIENLEDPEYFFEKVYEKAKTSIEKVYRISSKDYLEFLECYCKRYGKLSKGGNLNTDIACKILLHDWIKGKIPFYVKPPVEKEQVTEE